MCVVGGIGTLSYNEMTISSRHSAIADGENSELFLRWKGMVICNHARICCVTAA